MASESKQAAERIKAYVAAHLQEPITASDVAKAAGYSPFHTARIFKEETGLSPFEYIRRVRLTASAHALRSGGHRVLDIALDFVFASHEGFTRAFSNGFGISPKKYQSAPPPEGWLIPRRYLDRSKPKREDKLMDQTAVIFTQIIERPARKLILQRAKTADNYFDYVAEVGCGLHDASTPWDTLTTIKEALYEPVGLWLPETMRPEGTGIYAHGVEVPATYAGHIPDGFDVIDLAPCKLLVFQGEPYDDADFQTAVGLCMDRIEKFNPEVYGYQYAPELAPRMQLAPMGWRGYIEMKPIRKLEQQA
ncbi:MAG TPA: AraC family transcriptional regulator [Candidatus Limiplasma sp.]|nr:AraC family transcriptional regulator [Candidatus Limiplasma sp.]HRX08295.1 AraC family transcriptional regulator [Candidatus Limiplasma sp.]